MSNGFGDLKKYLQKNQAGQEPQGSVIDDFNSEIALQSSPVSPEEESIYRNIPRNAAVGALGLPNSWMQSQADEKRYVQDLPELIGGATKGGVGRYLGTVAVKPAGSALSAATHLQGAKLKKIGPQAEGSLREKLMASPVTQQNRATMPKEQFNDYMQRAFDMLVNAQLKN